MQLPWLVNKEDKEITEAELQVLATSVTNLIATKLHYCPQLAIENAAPELLGLMLTEYKNFKNGLFRMPVESATSIPVTDMETAAKH